MDPERGEASSSYRLSSETITGSDIKNSLLQNECINDTTLKGRRQSSTWRRHCLAACIHLMIFLTYSILLILAVDSRAKGLQQRSNLLYSPANEALKWEVHQFNSGDGHEGPYSGYPRPELEEAWEKLLGNMNVKFSLQDLQAFNREENAVQVPDGSGYIGTLNVYHEIHCVKWMHTYMYQEHYYPNLDDNQREENRLHSGMQISLHHWQLLTAGKEHCLNHLRKSAMCHGDVGMVTYKWANDSRKPAASATGHQCIDWDALTRWTDKRTVDMFKPGFLVHPTLGTVFRDGETKDPMD